MKRRAQHITDPWCAMSNKVYTEVSSEAKNPWRRDSNDGTFWMVFSDFIRLFTKVYLCRVFPDEDYRQYCIHGKSSQVQGFSKTI